MHKYPVRQWRSIQAKPVHKYPGWPHFPLLAVRYWQQLGSHCFAADLSAALPAESTVSDVGSRLGQHEDSRKHRHDNPSWYDVKTIISIAYFLELSVEIFWNILTWKACWGNLKTAINTDMTTLDIIWKQCKDWEHGKIAKTRRWQRQRRQQRQQKREDSRKHRHVTTLDMISKPLLLFHLSFRLS